MMPQPLSNPPQGEKVGLLKYAWRNLGIRKLVLERRFRALEQEWQAVRANVQPGGGVPANILIIPSDPELLTSSTGDQAMIGAIMAHWRQAIPHARLYVAVANDGAAAAAHAIGLKPLHLLAPSMAFDAAIKQVMACEIGTVVAMGADVLDGSYNVAFSGRQLMLLDLLALGGSDSYITGFSVSQDFHPRIIRLFDALDPSVRINLRDPVSFARFRSASTAQSNLVADVAFLLEPRISPRTEAISEWIADQRQAGRMVLGLNCHPLLLELEDRHGIDRFIDGFVDAIVEFADRRALAFLMIDHDSRGSSSDAICLRPVYDRLAERLGAEQLLYPDERLLADEIKAVVGDLDGVVSGRMHLMIAAMGAGTPVFGIDYKDKMEGLLNHFDLPTNMLCTAADFMRPGNEPAERFTEFVDRIDTIRAQVARAKPVVRAAAKQNFGGAA
jgi:colanic acid/amylovoran biosynthesis protein